MSTLSSLYLRTICLKPKSSGALVCPKTEVVTSKRSMIIILFTVFLGFAIWHTTFWVLPKAGFRSDKLSAGSKVN